MHKFSAAFSCVGVSLLLACHGCTTSVGDAPHSEVSQSEVCEQKTYTSLITGENEQGFEAVLSSGTPNERVTISGIYEDFLPWAQHVPDGYSGVLPDAWASVRVRATAGNSTIHYLQSMDHWVTADHWLSTASMHAFAGPGVLPQYSVYFQGELSTSRAESDIKYRVHNAAGNNISRTFVTHAPIVPARLSAGQIHGWPLEDCASRPFGSVIAQLIHDMATRYLMVRSEHADALESFTPERDEMISQLPIAISASELSKLPDPPCFSRTKWLPNGKRETQTVGRCSDQTTPQKVVYAVPGVANIPRLLGKIAPGTPVKLFKLHFKDEDDKAVPRYDEFYPDYDQNEANMVPLLEGWEIRYAAGDPDSPPYLVLDSSYKNDHIFITYFTEPG